MKFSFIIFSLFFYSTIVLAEIQNVKIEPGIQLKFNDNDWKYQYVKELSSVTPHFLESKLDKDFKVIIQKETHSESFIDKKNLITQRCAEANKFYQDSKQGFAKSIQIKNKSVCFIQLKRADKNSYQIVYPARFNKNSYDLLSYAWQDVSDKKLEKVSKLVGENL